MSNIGGGGGGLSRCSPPPPRGSYAPDRAVLVYVQLIAAVEKQAVTTDHSLKKNHTILLFQTLLY